jgi:hypothetical protein
MYHSDVETADIFRSFALKKDCMNSSSSDDASFIRRSLEVVSLHAPALNIHSISKLGAQRMHQQRRIPSETRQF